jgi:hypothetical protein
MPENTSITVRERIMRDREAARNSMLPNAVGSTLRAVDSLARSVENLCGIIEQSTEDLAEVSHLMLKQQRQRLQQELQPA